MSNVTSLDEFRRRKAEREKQKQQQGGKENPPQPTKVDTATAAVGKEVKKIVPLNNEELPATPLSPRMGELAQVCRHIKKIVQKESSSGKTYEDALKLIQTYPDDQLTTLVLNSNERMWKTKPVFFRAALDEINRRGLLPWTASVAELLKKSGHSVDENGNFI